MPKALWNALMRLTPAEKDAIWEWLDGDPDACHKMIALLAGPLVKTKG